MSIEGPERPDSRGGRRRVARLAVTVAMGVAALNIWTGAPLIALWAGSQAQGSGPLTMTSVGVVVVVFAALGYGLVLALARLGGLHDRLSGATPAVRAHAPWLRSMRAEREIYEGERPRLTGLERVLVVTVVVVTVAFEVWFLFYSTSPIDSRSGRGAVGPDAHACLRPWTPHQHALLVFPPGASHRRGLTHAGDAQRRGDAARGRPRGLMHA